MTNNSKVIAYYLPQYHEIPENNKWWGKGFTEWVNVKKAKPLFEGHNQPRIPKNNNYYDLSDVEVMSWQAKIAKENGLYGFCFYHYWFGEKAFMDKPIINYLNAKDINFPFCFCWANESWTNGWAKADASVIMEQTYGDREEWKRHFDFLLPFFRDSRYIKEDGKPLVVIYRPYLFEHMTDMLSYWEELAVANGLHGIVWASQRFEQPCCYQETYNYFDYHIEYQPSVARSLTDNKKTLFQNVRGRIHDFIFSTFNMDLSFHQRVAGPVKLDYDQVWKKIIETDPSNAKAIAGAFVDWDNTPRHARRGSVYIGVTPEKFELYMEQQIRHVKEKYDNNYLFLFAWNEWGEGGTIEPEQRNGYSYLTALKRAIANSDKGGVNN
jgi:hypothetical protein